MVGVSYLYDTLVLYTIRWCLRGSLRFVAVEIFFVQKVVLDLSNAFVVRMMYMAVPVVVDGYEWSEGIGGGRRCERLLQ